VTATSNSGFYAESVAAPQNINVKSIDITWKQIAPTRNGPLSFNTTGSAQGMSLKSLTNQRSDNQTYWLRLWASANGWMPDWVVTLCNVSTIYRDYDAQNHYPIWNDCIWTELMGTYQKVSQKKKKKKKEDLFNISLSFFPCFP
jgi:hypothetical protein